MNSETGSRRQGPPGEPTAPSQWSPGAHAPQSRRIREEETSRGGEDPYRALVHGLPGIVYRLFPAQGSRTEFFNDRVREMTGFTPEEFHPGEVCAIDPLIVPDDRPRVTETVKQAILESQPFEIEYRITNRDGAVRHFLERGWPVLSERGELCHLEGLIFDVTARKRAEETMRRSRDELELRVEERTAELAAMNLQLKKSQDLLTKTFASLSDAIFVVDADTRTIIAANPASERVFGYTRDELLGNNTELLHVDGAAYQTFGAEMAAALDTQGVYHREFQARHKDGRVIHTEHTVSQLLDESGRRTGLVSVVRDITERKAAEERLLAYQEQLRSLSSELSLTEERERRRLAGDLHDSVAQLLALAKFELEAARESSGSGGVATAIGRAFPHLDEAMEQVRSLMFELSPPDLYAIGLEAGLEGLAERMGPAHDLQVDFSADEIPEGALSEDSSILLYRSVKELLLNVVKHAGASRARLSLFREGHALRVEVEDAGIGCDAESVADHPRTERSGGFGLLSIKERLLHMGGRFQMSSQPGRGTLVALTVPLSTEAGRR